MQSSSFCLHHHVQHNMFARTMGMHHYHMTLDISKQASLATIGLRSFGAHSHSITLVGCTRVMRGNSGTIAWSFGVEQRGTGLTC